MYNLTNFVNVSSAAESLVAVSIAFPTIQAAILLFEYFVILLAGMGYDNAKKGFTNFFLWNLIAMFVTTVSAVAFTGVKVTYTSGTFSLVDTATVITCITLLIASALAYFLVDQIDSK